jgi:hypothetical protein
VRGPRFRWRDELRDPSCMNIQVTARAHKLVSLLAAQRGVTMKDAVAIIVADLEVQP